MTLTRKNMRSDPSGNVYDACALREDTSRMDAAQLKEYVQKAFLEESDEKFLPLPFWRDAFTSEYTPDMFFSGLYLTIPSIMDSSFTRSDGSMPDVDPDYSERLIKVLDSIANDCISYKKGPTMREYTLAQRTITTLGDIISAENSDSLENKVYRDLESGKIKNAGDLKEEIKNHKQPDYSSHKLFRIIEKIRSDKRYEGLNYSIA